MRDKRWSDVRSWADLRSGLRITLAPNEEGRVEIACQLDLHSLASLSAELTCDPWLDGVAIHGRIEAEAVRISGITLERFNESVRTEMNIRVVPDGSPNAPTPQTEIEISLEADDPPDAAPASGVDIAAYVFEALSLALDPFPRQPGEEFEWIDRGVETSPFAALGVFKNIAE